MADVPSTSSQVQKMHNGVSSCVDKAEQTGSTQRQEEADQPGPDAQKGAHTPELTDGDL